MNKRLLKQLRKELPKGYAKILAQRCGCSEMQVLRIFNKSRDDNYGVIETAVELMKENEEKKKALESKVKEALL